MFDSPHQHALSIKLNPIQQRIRPGPAAPPFLSSSESWLGCCVRAFFPGALLEAIQIAQKMQNPKNTLWPR